VLLSDLFGNNFRDEKMKIYDKNVNFELWVSWDCRGESLRGGYFLPVRGLRSGLGGLIVDRAGQKGLYKRLEVFDSKQTQPKIEGLSEVLMNPEHCADKNAFVGFINDNTRGALAIKYYIPR
jgi:hypothetical protein